MKIASAFDEQVKTLYLNELSAPQISKRLNVSLKRIYNSLKRQKIPRRTPVFQNKITFKNKPLSFRFKTDLSVKEGNLLIAALMLYMGEGTKNGPTVDFVNSDIRILRVFIKFLREICVVDERKIRIYLYCFSDQNPQELIDFWSEQLSVDQSQFTKPYIRTCYGKNTRRMSHGVVHIRYNDKRLLEKILNLCEELSYKLVF